MGEIQRERAKKPQPPSSDQQRPLDMKPAHLMLQAPGAVSVHARARLDPQSLSRPELQFLQRTIGNRAVTQLFQSTAQRSAADMPPRADISPSTRPEHSLAFSPLVPLYPRAAGLSTSSEALLHNGLPLQPVAKSAHPMENRTGLPDPLKVGVEQLSGLSMDDVQVHYNSSKPAQVQALAYTQGTEIHVGSGQEQHVPHEVWHVVQQKQGRVKPTLQAKGMPINDDTVLEHEADVMGSKAVHGALERERVNFPCRSDGGELAGEELSSVPSWHSTEKVVQRHPGPEKLDPWHDAEDHQDEKDRQEHRRSMLGPRRAPAAVKTMQQDVEAVGMGKGGDVAQVSPTITSRTKPPEPRTRTIIGVGEKIFLEYSGGSTTWATTGGQLAPTTGETTLLTAPDTEKKVTVTAEGATNTFIVIAPSSVHRDRSGTEILHHQGRPDIGMVTQAYLQPDTVNFYRVQYRELDFGAIADGVYAELNGVGHHPQAIPSPAQDEVIRGKGTATQGWDVSYVGSNIAKEPFKPGSLTWAIPYEYRVGNGPFHRFTVVEQLHILADDASTLTVDKAGAHGDAKVADEDSGLDWLRLAE